MIVFKWNLPVSLSLLLFQLDLTHGLKMKRATVNRIFCFKGETREKDRYFCLLAN